MAIRVYPYLSPRVIEVLAPLTEISIQDLTDQIKDWEDEPSNLTYPILVKTFGKQPLGGGVFVGITAELQNAKVSFAARAGPTEVSCTISGGNLVAVDENGASMGPIHPTAFVQVVLSQSSSATIATPPSDTNLLYLVESLLGRNNTVGSIWYWDPTSGNNNNDGTTPTNAVATFAQAQTLATAGSNDIIFALSTDPSGTTTVTEVLTITKNNLKVRGAGYGFQLKPASGSNPVTISADNVEFSNFYIQPTAGGTDIGMVITGDSAYIKNVWVKSATSHGISLSSSTRTLIEKCLIESCTGNGISIGSSTSLAKIKECLLFGNADGADLAGTAITDNIFETNLVYNNSGFGIDIGSGVVRTGVRLNHTFAGNTSGNTRDLGSGSFIETPAGGESASAIADAVLDELITDHLTSGTVGKTLKDIKTKATLASLK